MDRVIYTVLHKVSVWRTEWHAVPEDTDRFHRASITVITEVWAFTWSDEPVPDPSVAVIETSADPRAPAAFD
jgi:hypothetical protein